MAVANGFVPSPPPPPPPASRNIAASLARHHLGRVAADSFTCSVMFVFFASLWLVGAGALVSIVGRRICGDGCPVVTVASKVIPIACVIIALACPLFFVLVVIRIRMADSSVAMAEEDDQAAEKSWATVARELLHDTLALGLLASMIFLLIMVGGELLKRSESIKGARRERFGSVISFVGSVGAEAVYCLVIVPITAVRMWKTWRMP